MRISVRGQIFKNPPIAAHSYMTVLVRGLIPQKPSHRSPLLHGNFSSGSNCQKSSIAALTYMALQWGRVIPQKCSHCRPFLHGNCSQGVIPRKSSHCSATFTSFYPPPPPGPNSKLPPHPYINLSPIDESPPLLQKAGGL